jgi:hypothetical protein
LWSRKQHFPSTTPAMVSNLAQRMLPLFPVVLPPHPETLCQFCRPLRLNSCFPAR